MPKRQNKPPAWICEYSSMVIFFYIGIGVSDFEIYKISIQIVQCFFEKNRACEFLIIV